MQVSPKYYIFCNKNPSVCAGFSPVDLNFAICYNNGIVSKAGKQKKQKQQQQNA
jgi:hypothetical protein